MKKLYILTGPPGVGKSTIGRKVAEKLEKSVFIEGDDIYNFFVGGRVDPWLSEAPIELFWNQSIKIINYYLQNDYDVVFNYIIEPDDFKHLMTEFNKYEIHFKVLLVNQETIIKRDKERPLDCQMGERSIYLLNEFINYNYDKQYVLDTTNLSIIETVDKIIKKGEN